MTIEIRGAREHNLKNIDVVIDGELTVVTGVSGSGKSSLVFDTLYHEARRRFMEVYALGSVTDRLAPAKVRSINGLRPAVAVAQDLLNRNPNSTVASASGLSPLLRLLFARFGQRTCARCGHHLEVLSEEEISARLAALSASGPVSVKAPLVQGVKGSHRTLLNHLIATFDPAALSVDGHGLISGEEGVIEIPVLDPAVAHDIVVEIARLEDPISVVEAGELARVAPAMGAWGLRVESTKLSQSLTSASMCTACGTPFSDLEAADFNRSCPHCQGTGCSPCGGTGLTPEASRVRWAGYSLDELLTFSVTEAQRLIGAGQPLEMADILRAEIEKRLAALQDMGLGYVGLDRPAPTLSRGEGQRLRLAVVLVSRLEEMLYVLDEPTIGQHPADVSRLLPSLRRLNGQVVFVEHDRQAAAMADQVIDVGPGAGANGGQVVYSGTAAGLWAADTATGRCFSQRERVWQPDTKPKTEQFLILHEAQLRNLKGFDAPIPLGRMTVVCGVSGSGKSTLVEDVLVASLGDGIPNGCQSVQGPALKPLIVDQRPIGKNPRSNPATYTKLADIARDLFATASSLPASHFSFNRPEGACPDCRGMGAIEVRMRYLPSTWISCASCDGRRFSDDVLATKVEFGARQLTVADFFQLSVTEALAVMETSNHIPPSQQQRAARMLNALIDVGLGYLSLGQPSPSLSGGEAQRLKLARVLGGRELSSQLLVLDEPTTGLHPQDVAKLLVILDQLVQAGVTMVVVEHNSDVIRAADWIIDLGPGAGPSGGQLIYAGPLMDFKNNQDSPTAEALRRQGEVRPAGETRDRTIMGTPAITIRNARAHNLKGVDVEIPKNTLTVVSGLSGSGKSSLVNNVLEAEARRRFLESLSMYERQGSRPGPEVSADMVSGTGVIISVGPERRYFDRRATVGTATEISHHLAILLAWTGQRGCLVCGQAMRALRPTSSGLVWECPNCQASATVDARHFSPWHYAAACLGCNGVGTLQVPNPDKLIIEPDKPLCAGAMYSPGFFPKGYLGKPFNGGYDMVQALAERYDFDPFETPWNEMSDSAREAFLFGDPEPMEVHFRTRNQSYTRTQEFPGFYGFIRDWDVGGTYTDIERCPACKGARLRPEYQATSLAGHNYHVLNEMDLRSLAEALRQAQERDAEDMLVSRPAEVIGASQKTVLRRLQFLLQVGLGYLSLQRLTATLSAGEAQRIKLAGLLGGEMSGLTILLDEPSRGLHPSEVKALQDAMLAVRDQGNSVIVIEHDVSIIRAADHVIDIGPGAGADGGKIVAQGTPAEVARSQSVTGAWLRGEGRIAPSSGRGKAADWITITGARANNLSGESISIPRRRLVGVCGLSGSGKSSLIVDTLGRALAPKKHTTSVAREPLAPGRFEAIHGAPARTVVVDQVRAGVSSPASYLGIDRPLRMIYAESEQAQDLGLSVSDFSRDCSACKGRGVTKIDLGVLPPLRSQCDICNGSGYGPQVQQIRLADLTLPELTGCTIAQLLELAGAHEVFDQPRIRRPLEAARDVGLGYLVLRQPGHALSGGEAQRLKIARELYRKGTGETLYILDEPSVGQHMDDLQRLGALLDRLVGAGHSVIVVEHEIHILAVCDWLIELGPGGGPEGGRVIFSGIPSQLAAGDTAMAPFLKSIMANESIE